jgi:pyruvate kinase
LVWAYPDRRVKIVTTLGPSVSGQERLRGLLEAGADVVRINASHGTEEGWAQLISDVRTVSAELGRRVPILFDLQGLKIRTGAVPNSEAVPVARGATLRIVPRQVESSTEVIGIGFPDLLKVIEAGSRLLISDGLIELLVEEVNEDHARCIVSRGGMLNGRQGVTLPGAPIKGGSVTEQDRADIAFAAKHGVDFLGLSFVNDASDVVLARKTAAEHGAAPGLIAKIESGNALENVEEIARESDGLMVARGDLGVQLPPERVPRAQKRIIAVANRMGIPVITATQMLESMITQPVATRAETSDIANAVWDGTDAVMLSAESATGKYPYEAVQTMDRIIKEIERDGPIRSESSQLPLPHHPDESLNFADAIARAGSAMADASELAKLIVVFTYGGAAARRMAKYRPSQPIVAVCSQESIATRLNLVWGVRTLVLPLEQEINQMFDRAGEAVIEAGLGTGSDYALLVGSLPMVERSGTTNLLHVRPLTD